MSKMNILFSPPDITEEEIEEVVDTTEKRMDYNRSQNKVV